MTLRDMWRRLPLPRAAKRLVVLTLLSIWRVIAPTKARKYVGRKGVYLFMPINGVGLGHLNRCLSVASALKKQEPEAEIVFLTTSIALPIVHRFGFSCHHVTPAALAGADVGPYEWNRLFANTIEEVMSIYRPGKLIFDGSYPYTGLQKVIASYKGKMSFCWIKRGLYKSSVDTDRLAEQLRLFDSVVSPGEISGTDRAGPQSGRALEDGRLHDVNPIYLLEPAEILTRSEAREALALDPKRKVAFVQLGAGNINDIEDLQKTVVEVLQESGFEVVVAKSPISLGESSGGTGADREIVDFPTSRFMNAFDLAVVAGGYNSVCESVVYDVPTIFVPNLSTGSDDQLKRVESVAKAGRFEVIAEFGRDKFSGLVERLTGEELRKREEREGFHFENGAKEAARIISSR